MRASAPIEPLGFPRVGERPENTQRRHRNCLKVWPVPKRRLQKPKKRGDRGSFRCGLPAIPTLETPLSYFLDSFRAKFDWAPVYTTQDRW
jgi:hypothetical protein